MASDQETLSLINGLVAEGMALIKCEFGAELRGHPLLRKLKFIFPESEHRLSEQFINANSEATLVR